MEFDIVLAPPVEKSIDVNDFEKVIDEKTGKEFYRLTEAAARRKGLTNVQDMEFDVEIDEKTGKTIIKPKVNIINGQQVEVIVDEETGEQIIRIVHQKPPDFRPPPYRPGGQKSKNNMMMMKDEENDRF